MRSPIKTYKVLLDFRSRSLRKSFQPGQIVKAPKPIGTTWVVAGLAIEFNPKTTKP